MTRSARLHEIVKCCEIRFNRGDAITWKHGDFVDLNREIQRETNTNISPSTLKRIVGKISVDDDYVPQQATLDALKKYGKYVEREDLPPTSQPPAQPRLLNSSGNFKRWKIVLIILTVIAGIAGLLTWRLLKPKRIIGKISLTRTEGHLPATAFFELQLPETDDRLFINFGDKSPRAYLTHLLLPFFTQHSCLLNILMSRSE